MWCSGKSFLSFGISSSSFYISLFSRTHIDCWWIKAEKTSHRDFWSQKAWRHLDVLLVNVVTARLKAIGVGFVV